jgi:hypothetical protein
MNLSIYCVQFRAEFVQANSQIFMRQGPKWIGKVDWNASLHSVADLTDPPISRAQQSVLEAFPRPRLLEC